jgi:hypothetical protein
MKKLLKASFETGTLHLVVLAIVFAFAMLFAGCAMERADPAARSNRATYTISIVAKDGSTATAYIADGLMATADGEGAVSQPSTLTTEQSPDITVPGDAVSAGIQAVGHVTGKAIDAYSASKASQGTGNGGTGNGGTACKDGSCKDGNCTDCTDGSCGVK